MSMAVGDLFNLVRELRRPKVKPTPPFNAEGIQPPRVPVARAPPTVMPPPVADVASTYTVDEPPVMERPALSRPRIVPGEPVNVSAPAITAPTLQKPMRLNTGDPLADESAYARQIATYKPVNDNSRASGVGLGALRGLGRGGLMGALVGAIRGGFDKSLDEREHWAGESARSQANLAGLYGQRKADQDYETGEVENAYKLAQAVALGRPKPREPKLFQGADGLQYEYDPEKRVAVPIPGQSGKAAGAKPLNTVVRGKKVWYETPEGLQPATDPATGLQLTDEDELVEVTYGGQTYKVSPQKAAELAASIDAANIGAGNKYGEQSYEDQVRAAQRQREEYETKLRRRDAAAKMIGDFERAKQEGVPFVDRDGKQQPGDLSTARGLAASIAAAYPDEVEVGQDANGYPYVKLKPTPPAPQIAAPRRPAPALRPPLGRPQARGGYTEAEVRARAAAAPGGATPEQIEAAVRLARQRGLLR